MLFPARAALDSIQFSRRLGDSIRILRTALDGGSSWIRTSVIFHNATVFMYRVSFHNRPNKEPFQNTLLSIIRNGFTCRCVSVLQVCFKVVPRERFELNYPPVMSRSLLPIKLPRQFTVSPVCHAFS